MARLGPSHQPTFFWQGALIVLPVILLVAIGAVSLRQDKVLAQYEAAERAQTVADDLASKVWTGLTTSNEVRMSPHLGFEIDAAGELVFPRPYSPMPVPHPYDTKRLTADQATLWRSARQAEATERNLPAAIAASRGFLDLKPPQDFRSAARYALGVMLLNQQKPDAAAEYFESVLEEDPAASSESGVPLWPLAAMKLQELAASGLTQLKPIVSLEILCSNAVYQPTALSSELLRILQEQQKTSEDQEAVRRWRARWEEQEASRGLFQAASQQLRTAARRSVRTDEVRSSVGPMPEPHLFWLTTPVSWTRTVTNNTASGSSSTPSAPVEIKGNDWLCIQLGEGPTNSWFYCLGEAEVGARVSALINLTARIPDYFGIGVELAGRRLTWSAPDLHVWREGNYFGRRGGGVRKEYIEDVASTILASARRLHAGTEQLKVNVYLTSPSVLFRLQRARTFWFGFLIAAAALVALVGFLAAYRAFHRQLRMSEMKSNFVSSVSHELRAPIASVRLLAESLERGKILEAPKQHEYFRFIVQECRRLSSLIENVLDFSRIEQGRKEYEFEPTDIATLVQQTVKLMESYAAERQVQLVLAPVDCQLALVSDQIFLDGKAIQQALINLIDNAIKHSPKGQSVTVGAEVLALPSGAQSEASSPQGRSLSAALTSDRVVNLWVEDHGEGIPAAEHEKIFERFYRRGSELRRETSGVGIGLSIVKHIVEAHHGRVLVRSEVGHGSRFTIELPLLAEQSEMRHPDPEQPRPNGRKPEGNKVEAKK